MQVPTTFLMSLVNATFGISSVFVTIRSIGHKKGVFCMKKSAMHVTARDIFATIPQKGIVRAQSIVIGGFCFKV